MAYNNYNNNGGGGYGYGGSNPYGNQNNNYNESYGAPNPYNNNQSNFSRPNAPPAYGQTGDVEMQRLNGQQAAPLDAQDPNAILNECRDVSRAVDQLEGRLQELQRLQRNFVSGSGTSNKEIDMMSSDIMSGYRGLADRVKRIKSQRAAQDPRNRPQVEALDRRIRKAINTYQQVESSFRKEVQEQQRRQYLIVRPDATETEIREATESGADAQIFQQALLNSDRRGQAQSTLRNVQQRHEAIQHIERTMLELQQLFQDLDAIVVQQDPQIMQVEQKAEETHTHLEAANQHVSQAVVSARAARKKKWILLAIIVIIIVIIICAVLGWLASRCDLGNCKQNNN